MEKSIGSTIEKIKLQELSTEAKLKEKREMEATIATINRKIREAKMFVEKSQTDQADLAKKIDKLRCQVLIDRVYRDALIAQIGECEKELEELTRQSDEGISSVWNIRSTMCNATQKVVDEYDIWPLLMRPAPVELQSLVKSSNFHTSESEERLKEALKKREKLLAERDRLFNEPDTSEEFVRIKDALKYSLEKVASLQNN